ncbi:MAG: GNAT family N-acetyltransferase [Chloroflexi bacterium]|nr:GNAT family N-acetyltransferase [Chloroflexota bacterium]
MNALRFVRFGAEHLPVFQSWFEDEATRHWLSTPDLRWFEFVTTDPQTFAWMIYDGNVPIGQAQVGHYNDDSRQASIACAVAPDRRNRGYATHLLHHLLRQTELADVEQFHAFVHPDNGASVRLVHKTGFQLVSPQPDEDGFLHYAWFRQ